MTYLERDREQLRRKVATWHTLWELGQARAALRRMGEVLPVPPARSREAFADAIYNLADQDFRAGTEEVGRTMPGSAGAPDRDPFVRLKVLDGGLGGNTVPVSGGGFGPEASSPAAVGREPPLVAEGQPGEQPTHIFDRED